MTMKRALPLMIFLAVVLAAWEESFAFIVLAVKSRNLAPYDDAVKGFKSGPAGRESEVVTLDEGADAESIAEKVSEVKADLIWCIGADALEKTASIRTVPRVYCMVPWIRAVAAGEDVYGVAMEPSPEVQFRIVAKALPKVKRLGVLYNPSFNSECVARAASAAAAAGLGLTARPVSFAKDIPEALELFKGKIDLLWSIFDATAYGPETLRYLLLNTLKMEIPFLGFSPQLAGAGAVMAIYGDYEDMGRQCSELVAESMHGNGSFHGPVEPRRVRIAVNTKVIGALHVSLPSEFLKNVDQVY